MDQRINGSPPKHPPRPSYASMLARGSPPPSSPPTTLPRITYDLVFIDPIDGHLARLPIPPMGLRAEELVNPRAVAYRVPARYKVSIETFADAAAKSLSTAINPTDGTLIAKPFLSAIRHPGAEFDRMENVYHEALDAFKVSTISVIFKKTAYPPLSSTIDFTVTKITFSEYQFHTSADAGDNLCVWVKELLETKKPMGKVILIEISTRSSPDGFRLPNNQAFVYVKGDITPEAAGLGRQHSLPHHQRNPIKVHWTTHGDPNFCNYCNSEGHVLGKCALRLSKICSKCKAAGHLQAQCDRFSERDLKTAKGNEFERNLSSSGESSSTSNFAGTASSSSAPSSPHAAAAVLPLSPPKTPAAVASSSSLMGPSSAPAAFASLLEAAKAVPASLNTKGKKAARASTSGVGPPAPSEPLSPSAPLSLSRKTGSTSTASPSPFQSPSSSSQEFSPTVLSLVGSPRFIPGTPENELFDAFIESQVEELVLTDFTKKNISNKKVKEVNNKRYFHDSSANTSVTSVLQQVGTRVTQKYMKRSRDQGVHGTYVASSRASTRDGSSSYTSSLNKSQVFEKQKKDGLFQSMGKSVKKTVSKIVSPSSTSPVRRPFRRRVFTQKPRQ